MLAQSLRGRHALAKGPLDDLGMCQSQKLKLGTDVTDVHVGGERFVVGWAQMAKGIVGWCAGDDAGTAKQVVD
jgi:hypothetical protein